MKAGNTYDKWGQQFDQTKHTMTEDGKIFVSGGMCEIKGRSKRPTLLHGQVIEFRDGEELERGFVLEHKKRREGLGDLFRVIKSSTGMLTVVDEENFVRALPACENLPAQKK